MTAKQILAAYKAGLEAGQRDATVGIRLKQPYLVADFDPYTDVFARGYRDGHRSVTHGFREAA